MELILFLAILAGAGYLLKGGKNKGGSTNNNSSSSSNIRTYTCQKCGGTVKTSIYPGACPACGQMGYWV